jgi:uncharacterized protein YdiU (UPF0061 family)
MFRPLLNIMEDHALDFHSTFRTLSSFRGQWLSPSTTAPGVYPCHESVDKFVTERLLTATPDPSKTNIDQAKGDWRNWLAAYAKRIQSEHADAESLGWDSDFQKMEDQREKEMRASNPRFVLRQWVLEDVIKKVERDSDSGKRVLAKVMHMACNPFEPWGAEDEPADSPLDEEEKAEREYCGLGEKKMLGFQCSCSS